MDMTARANRLTPHVLGLFRIVVGLLFACHGARALFGWFGVDQHLAAGQWPGWWAAVIQFAGGLLVVFGVGTRTAALLCSGSMAYAYFTTHQPHALLPIQNGGEPAVLFCWAFLIIAAVGPGSWALTTLLRRRHGASVAPSTSNDSRLATAARP